MKVLMLSITAGYGHHAAAKSIEAVLHEKNIETETLDVYKSINKLLYKTVDKFYLIFTKYTRKPYGFFYNYLATREHSPEKRASGGFLTKMFAHKFESYINDFNPDVIICTHIYAALVVNELKRKKKIGDIPTIGIVTDYTVHPFWDCVSHLDYIEVANEFISDEAIKKGIPENRLLPLGIPIDKKFSSKLSKDAARKELGLDSEKRTILVMAGSMGYGNLPSIISGIHTFDSDCQILAVCGNNKKHFKKLSALSGSSVKVFRFTDKIDVFMDAADCIITKPGGLSTSEAMAKQLPMILVNPIPGHEEKNLKFFISQNSAIAVTKSFKIEDALHSLFDDEEKLAEIKRKIAELSKSNASEDIANFIISNIEK